MSKFFTSVVLVFWFLSACTFKQMNLVVDTIDLPDDEHGNPQVYEHYTSDKTLRKLDFKMSGSTDNPSGKISSPGRAGEKIEFEPIVFFTLQLTNPQKWCRKKMKTKIDRSQKKRYKELKRRAKNKNKYRNGNF